MKQYTKPTVNVVELAVRENIAALPAALKGKVATDNTISSGNTVTLTTYNLAALNTSEVAGA